MAGSVKVVLKSVFDDKGIRNAQAQFAGVGKSIGKSMAAIGAVVAVAGAATIKFGSDAIRAAEGVRQANDRLAQINNSMGLFGSQTSAVTDRLIKFAEANELNVAVDAEVIKATQAKLLTFKALGETADEAGGAFDRATIAALDLAAAGFGSAETNAIQLGKALQDPIKGLSALRRAGVTFNEQEKQNIKTLVESGKTLQAQELILKAIETQVGGTAAATATGSQKMKLAFENVLETVGAALMPAFDDLSEIVVKDLAPALADVAEEIGPFLVDTMKLIAEVLKDATDESTPLGKSVKNLGDQFGILFDALAGGKADVEGTTSTLSSLADIIAFLVTTMASFVAFLQTLGPAIDALLKGDIKTFWEWLNSDPIDFLKNQRAAQNALAGTRDAFLNTADSARRLNSIKLDGLRGQLGDIRIEGNKLAKQQRELYYAMRGEKPPAEPGGGGGTTTGGGGGTGPTLAQQRAEAAKQFNALVKETKAKLAQARSAYQKAVNEANETLRKANKAANDAYVKAVDDATTNRNKALEAAAKDNAKTVESINKNYSGRLADIVRDSINRLRSAYQSAVAVDVGRLFGEEAIGNNVDKLVENLRNKLEASRRLISNTSALAAQGFSQTFIEQVVSAGTETGNELAQAILEATPETRGELKSLFNAIEAESETGMNALSKEIYDKAGLATTALKTLYSDTQNELAAALTEQASLYAEQQTQIMTDFNEALTAASVARNAALQAARDAYVEDINAAFDAYKEDLKRIEKEYKDKLAGIENLSKELKRQGAALASQIDSAGKFIPKGIEPAKDIQTLPFVVRNNGANPAGNTININVKTDPTQTPALVGKQIANVVQRYTAVGGGAGGSAMPWQVL